MLPGQASQTLSVASIMRARHQLFDTPVIFDDPVVLMPEARDPGILKDLGDATGRMASHCAACWLCVAGSLRTGWHRLLRAASVNT
jgi:hypothetical protein